MAILVAACALAALTLAGRATGALTAVLAVALGASERLRRPFIVDGSDVDNATSEALGVLLSGQNPYAHSLQSTIPPGSPLVYGPGELLFYLPAQLAWGEVGSVEKWVGILTVAVIATVGFRIGFARVALPAMLYASWGIAAFRTTDGGNDVGAALVVVAGLAALAFAGPGRSGRIAFVLSAVLFGWSLAFKQFVVVIFPLVVRHLAVSGARWKAWALIAIGVAAALDLPFLLWDPAAFVNQHLVLALTNHRETWGANLLFTLMQLDPRADALAGAMFVAEVGLTLGALALLLRWRIPSIGHAALAGAGLVALPLFLARWTTQSYYVYAATVALLGLALLEVRARSEDRSTSIR